MPGKGRTGQAVQGPAQVGPRPLLREHGPGGLAIVVQNPGAVNIGQLDVNGAGAGRQPPFPVTVALLLEDQGDPRHRGDGVEQHLGIQGARQRMRVVGAVFPVGWVGPAAELVGPGAHDGFHQMAKIMVVVPEVLCQCRQQPGVGGRIGRAEIVDRLHHSSAEKIAPYPIDRRLGEKGMSGHPLGQPDPRVGPFRLRQEGAVQEGRKHLLPGAGMKHFATPALDEQVHLLTGWVLKDDRTGLLPPPSYQVHASEECSQPPKLILAPGFKGMVMALGAVQPASHEDSDLFGHLVLRITHLSIGQEVSGRRTVADGCNALPGHLVVGSIAGDVAANPLPVTFGPLQVDAVLEESHPEKLREPIGPIIHELGGLQERIDQLLPLARVAALQKLPGPSRRGQRAGQIQAHPPQELLVAGKPGGDPVQPVQLVEHQAVDEVIGGNAGISGKGRLDDADPGGRGMPRRPNGHKGLPGTQAPQPAARSDFRHLAVVGLIVHLAGEILAGSILEQRADQQLLPASHLQHGLGGVDLEGPDPGSRPCVRLKGSAVFHPPKQRPIIFRFQRQLLATLMGLGQGRLQEQQALFRLLQIDARDFCSGVGR